MTGERKGYERGVRENDGGKDWVQVGRRQDIFPKLSVPRGMETVRRRPPTLRSGSWSEREWKRKK